MTVAELIKELRKCDDNAEVFGNNTAEVVTSVNPDVVINSIGRHNIVFVYHDVLWQEEL